MMTLWEAVEARISCRSYQEKPVDAETKAKLAECIAALNEESGLRFQLMEGDPAVKLAETMFAGKVTLCAALVGGEDPISAEKLGYYGEKFVLYATQLGLGTCWVAGTYDRNSVSPVVEAGEKLWDVIPLGWPTEKQPMKQKMIRAAIRKRDRKIEAFLESELSFAQCPDWVRKGIEAMLKGPSAVNQQPVNIQYKDGRVFARLWKDGMGLQFNDMGIAKAQFEVGAAEMGVQGKWDFGDGGEFHVL